MAERGARLLVVDDNKVNRLLLIRTLELQGHRGVGAENGRVALGMLEREPFDLVLLDIAMPEMDGFQVLERLLANSRLRELPVIVTSAVEGMDSVVRCIELGADDYLRKPVNPVLLRARVNSSLEKKRLRDTQKELLQVRATVMFSDIRGFTTLCASQPPDETIELLNTYYTLMFDAISGHGGVVNQMIGDGLMAVFGAPRPLADAPAAAVRAALDMIEMIDLFNAERALENKSPIAIGIGIASGEMVAGYTGTQRRATYTCVGDTVNLAARLEAHTKVAQRPILIDAATRAALADGMAVEAIGAVPLKGLAQPIELYSVAVGGAA